MSETVEVVCTFADSSLSPLEASVTARPAVVAPYERHGVPYTVTRSAVRSQRRGRESHLRLIPSADPGWMTDGPVPYRITESARGISRTYLVLVSGPGTFDLATCRKWSLSEGPPAPALNVTRMKRTKKRPLDKAELLEVTAAYIDASVAPVQGVVYAKPMVVGTDLTPSPTVVTAASVASALDSSGRFTMLLIPSDHHGWLVGGRLVPYRFSEDVDGLDRSWCATIVPGGPADLSMQRELVSCVDAARRSA